MSEFQEFQQENELAQVHQDTPQEPEIQEPETVEDKKIRCKFPRNVHGLQVEQDGQRFFHPVNINGKEHKVPLDEEIELDEYLYEIMQNRYEVLQGKKTNLHPDA